MSHKLYSLQELAAPVFIPDKPGFIQTSWNPAFKAYILLEDQQTVVVVVRKPGGPHQTAYPAHWTAGDPSQQWVHTQAEFLLYHRYYGVNQQDLQKFCKETQPHKKDSCMGNEMPLPERIPEPTAEQAAVYRQWQVHIGAKPNMAPMKVGQTTYVPYTLPESWTMVNRTQQPHLPKFVLLDAEQRVRAVYAGAWKGTYDCWIEANLKEAPWEREGVPNKQDAA